MSLAVMVVDDRPMVMLCGRYGRTPYVQYCMHSPVNCSFHLTVYLTLCGLTGEPIIAWGRGLRGLVCEKADLCLSKLLPREA